MIKGKSVHNYTYTHTHTHTHNTHIHTYINTKRERDTNRAVIVSNHPGKYRVLHEVIVRATSQCIEVHQVLEVRNFTTLYISKEKTVTKKKTLVCTFKSRLY